MGHSMDGDDAPWGVQDTFAEARYEAERGYTPRQPTARELDAMNAERPSTAHEDDEEHYGIMGDKVVQVRIAGASARTYAYEVPRPADVSIGTWVRLPGNVVNEDGGFGIVRGFGRDGYDGPLKMISGVIDEPDPLMVQMSVAKSKEQAAKIYDQAVTKGLSRDVLLELIEVGRQRLASRGVS